GQTRSLTGPLLDHERRLVAARAILGEWLGGSGGGWQDSGGVWPGIKLIEGVVAEEGDPEYGISRGCLLPQHRILAADEVDPETRRRLQDSLVLVHGGMAQNVGPILEMVTEKYLLRSESEWRARQDAVSLLDEVLGCLRQGDVPGIGEATTRNFRGPLQTIIPWASNLYTESLIGRAQEAFGPAFWGFWMLGGMSGGGMGFIIDPRRRGEAQDHLLALMADCKRRFQNALPFAMEPVVYDFAINERGTYGDLLAGADALLPADYYALIVPALLRQEHYSLAPSRRREMDAFGTACRTRPELAGIMQTMFDAILPRDESAGESGGQLDDLLRRHGFDRTQHEQIRQDLRSGRIGLAQNRLPVTTDIRDVRPGDVHDATTALGEEHRRIGRAALENGEVAVVTLAGGVGSRWTQGAGVVKALHPFCKLGGRHRSFIETHLAKSRRIGAECGVPIPHVITTSYLTHEPIASFLREEEGYNYPGPLHLSEGRAIGLRFVPMTRDLRFAWEEMPHQMLDEQAQKVLDSLHNALLGWARSMGEGRDYRDNLALQCLNPIGHWYEVPNLIKSGVLSRLLAERPGLRHLMVHNIDTLGADVDPAVLGLVKSLGAPMTVEVINRRVEDRGGGLARVDGRLRLLEGLALPREEDEFRLTYYNSNTFWLRVDNLLELFGLSRETLGDAAAVDEAVRRMAARVPTYITLKEVKKRWGHGQEDVYPVAQYEKLWGDMTALADVECAYLAVPRLRGQQLKEQAQLDGWYRDGSAAYVDSLCAWR
ncbi:MAG: UTP--glucose-1-phosphate uridylyltransferase, partial [Chloroflexi bacterium]|nr:UTP--glucose-1-phosphate uridylyltransferase [Chloroflexota bacterium]